MAEYTTSETKSEPNGHIVLYGALDKDISEYASLLSAGKVIVAVTGEYGSGKSVVVNAIKKKLPVDVIVKDWILSSNLADQLRALPLEKALREKIVVHLDEFEFIEAFDDKVIKKLTDLIVHTARAGVGLILEITHENLQMLNKLNPELKSYLRIYQRRNLNYHEAKEMILSELNKLRKRKTVSFEPFSEHEIKNIWQNTKGNPKLTLLLIDQLYSIKIDEIKK